MLFVSFHRKLHLAVAFLIVMAPLVACHESFSQTADASKLGEQLEQLISVEKSAVDAGDPTAILNSGRQLGSLTLVLLGRLYEDQGRCVLASEAYQQSLQVDDTPERLQERVQTGLLLLGSELCANRLDAANSAAGQVVKMAGDTAQTHLLIANTYHGAGDLGDTIRELGRIVVADPQFGPAYLALGNAYWELNEYQYNSDTLREFTAAQRLRPEDPFANQSLGFILSQYERYQEAAVYLGNAIAEDPASPDAWLQVGMNAYTENHFTEALTSLQRAIELTGTDVSRNGYQIRRAYAVMGRIEAAQGHIEEAKQFDQRGEALRALIQGDKISSPLTESTSMVATSAPNFPEKRAMTRAAELTNQQRELEKHLKEIVATSLNDAGTALARGREYEAAVPLFHVASVANPDLQPVMRNLGLAAFHAGDYAEATEALAVALRQNPDDTLVRDDLDQARAQLGPRKP